MINNTDRTQSPPKPAKPIDAEYWDWETFKYCYHCGRETITYTENVGYNMTTGEKRILRSTKCSSWWCRLKHFMG